MMKGVTFGTIHSYDDLGLILKHIEIGIPTAKTSSLDIESSDGVVDTTNALSDIVFFNNRTITFEFGNFYDAKWYTEKLSSIVNQLHGRRMQIILDNDDTWYYVGRLSVEADSDKVENEVVIECDCEPYKYSISETIHTYEVSGEQTYTIDYICTKPLVPVWHCTIADGESLSLILNGAYYSLSDGENIVADFIIKTGVTTFTLAGNGTAQMRYREAIL